MEVLKSEVLKYEDDFADMQLENGTLREQLEEQHLVIAKMKTFADNPEPRIHFGEAREQYSSDVFRFAAKILNCKLTCKTAHRGTEVFMEEFCPGKKHSYPPTDTMGVVAAGHAASRAIQGFKSYASF